jgi:hypothetical protein
MQKLRSIPLFKMKNLELGRILNGKRAGCPTGLIIFSFRKITVEGNLLKVNWQAEEARILRTSAQSLLQLLILVTQTIEQFDGME